MTKDEAIQILSTRDAHGVLCGYTSGVTEALDMAIEALQEVQKHEETFEWCTECKEYDKDNHCCHRWSKTIRNTVEELKTDRPKGEWIKATGMMPPEFHGHHCCSECGNFANMESPFGNREDLSKFCPNCGARMKGGAE